MLSVQMIIEKNLVVIIGLIQRLEEAGKERRTKRPVNQTLRIPVQRVKTVMNIRENGKEWTEAVAMNKV